MADLGPTGPGSGDASGTSGAGGGPPGPGGGAYYEHPLTAATTAMLNIGPGAAAPEDHAQSSMGFIYEYYKLPAIDKDKLAEIWPTSSATNPVLTVAHSTKAAAAAAAAAAVTAAAAAATNVINAAAQNTVNELEGLFLQPPHVFIKREPEDLSAHRKSPGTRITVKPEFTVDVANNNIKEEVGVVHHVDGTDRSTPASTSSLLEPGNVELQGATTDGSIKTTMAYAPGLFLHGHAAASGSPSPIPYDHVTGQYTTAQAQGPGVGYISTSPRGSSSFTLTPDQYPYREYFPVSSEQYGTLRQPQQPLAAYTDADAGGAGAGGVASALMERYVRQSNSYHAKGVGPTTATGLTVDLPSPDSGIGTDAITPRDQTAIQPSFDYNELCQQAGSLMPDGSLAAQRAAAGQSPSTASPGSGSTGAVGSSGRSRPWHDFGRQNDADKIQIPKLFLQYGFKYHLETPISTSQRREDDRITYINKGQFYGITLEYIPDPDKPLKSQTVKSIVMLMFREEKSPEDEIKAWQFWHGRQHSVKQRILDADTKNSVGLVGCIEEVAHNAIAVYWNPLESSAKINVAVQCLSTDFSSQKGVKGLPLHLQIDTYEDPREGPICHRGYCQIKVFCDKGAERKTRDEERRAAKRKMTATGRKKLDELYHPPTERSEFYAMSDLSKPPVLFSPAEDIDKLTSMELQGFYGHDADNSSMSNGEATAVAAAAAATASNGGGGGGGSTPKHHHHHPHHHQQQHHVQQIQPPTSPYLLHASKTPPTPTLKFHNHFPPEPSCDKKDLLDGSSLGSDSVFGATPLKRAKLSSVSGGVSGAPLSERVMLYVRQETDEVYTPLHVVPPTAQGLLNAIENKYKISTSSIINLYRKNKKGIIAKIDDDMIKYYCNEDLFLLEVKQSESQCDILLIELSHH